MASRMIPAVAPRRVAKGASRISRGRMFDVVTQASTVPALFPSTVVEQSAPRARKEPTPALVLDSGLGAMRGLAFVLMIYLVLAASAFGALMVWHLLR